MSLVFAIYVLLPVVTIVIASVLIAWIYTHHRQVRGADWFLLQVGFGIGWMGCFLLHILLEDVGLQILSSIFATKFATWSSVANIVFISVYSESNFHRHPVPKALLGIVLGITLLPTWVEPLRSVFYESFTPRTEPFPHVVVESSSVVGLLGLVLAGLTAYGLYQMVRYMLATPRRSGVQLGLFVLGSLSVMAATAIDGDTGILVDGFSNTEFGVLPSIVLVAVAIFRFRLFDVLPVARNAVVEELRDPVFVLDSDRCLADYNTAATAVVPEAADLLGRPFADVHPGLAAGIDVEDQTTATTQLSLAVDGETRHFSVNVSRVGDGDGADVDWYSILLRDVTDLQRSRWQLAKQNERLEQVAQTISHDLRNPINVADGHLELLNEELSGESLTEAELTTARQCLDKAQGSHDRMLEIIEDILTIARGGKTVEQTEPVSLGTVAWDAWENVETGAATLSVDGERNLEADRSKLLSVFENLFRNSVEHGSTSSRPAADDSVEHGSTGDRSSNGAGTDEATDVAVTVESTPDGFAVADDGPGIPEAHQDEVFADGYTTTDSGTGLGLAIVETMTESHGWTVDLDTAADGARFVFHTDETPAATSERDEVSPVPGE